MVEALGATGLCGACRHARMIRSDRGSRFLLCRRSATEPRFARYPRLPVLRCPGFEPTDGDESTRDGGGGAAPGSGAGPGASA